MSQCTVAMLAFHWLIKMEDRDNKASWPSHKNSSPEHLTMRVMKSQTFVELAKAWIGGPSHPLIMGQRSPCTKDAKS